MGCASVKLNSRPERGSLQRTMHVTGLTKRHTNIDKSNITKSWNIIKTQMANIGDNMLIRYVHRYNNGHLHEKPCLWGFADIKGRDQPAHSCSPISAFVNRLLQNMISKIVSEYDQEIPQSQTADNPVAPRGRAAQPSRDIRKTN